MKSIGSEFKNTKCVIKFYLISSFVDLSCHLTIYYKLLAGFCFIS
jgi:hypothetical protein